MITLFRKSRLLAFGLAASLGLLPLVAVADYASAYKQYGSVPVKAQLRGGNQEWLLTGMKDGQIEVTFTTGDSMTLDSADLSLVNRLALPPVSTPQYVAFTGAGDFKGAAELLRPAVYPLLKFDTLPADYAQFYDAIELLLGALVSSEQFSEAAQILKSHSGLLAQERFQRRAFAVIEGLAQSDKTGEAVELLGLVPLDQMPPALRNVLLAFAYDLRIRGEYEALIPVYEQMLPLMSGRQQIEAKIWLAYCYINTGDVAKGEAILAELPAPAPGQENFGLYQLLHGYKLYREGQYGEAIDVFARGLVYARSVEQWIPEVSFYIGNCYRSLGKEAVARATYEEIFKLYPENPWAKRARAAYDELAPKAQPAS